MQNKFSRLEFEVERQEEKLNRLTEIQSASAFPEHLLTQKWIKYRLSNSKNCYEFFNKTYFPPEVHKRGYFQPGRLQKAIPQIAQLPGFYIVLGPRGYGKTVTAIISVIWLFLKGDISFLGTYSETLDKARSLMGAISTIIQDNPRIQADYSITVEVDNDNEFRFRIAGLKHACSIKPYSLDRSVRGAIQLFDRVIEKYSGEKAK